MTITFLIYEFYTAIINIFHSKRLILINFQIIRGVIVNQLFEQNS